MASSPTSEPSDAVAPLRTGVRGHAGKPGLAVILPKLQQGHRRELRREPHWSKEELVRHPEPRELIRSMRKPGNLDVEGRPVYTLDERRLLTADIYENRMVRAVVDDVRGRLRSAARHDAGGRTVATPGRIANVPPTLLSMRRRRAGTPENVPLTCTV